MIEEWGKPRQYKSISFGYDNDLKDYRMMIYEDWNNDLYVSCRFGNILNRDEVVQLINFLNEWLSPH